MNIYNKHLVMTSVAPLSIPKAPCGSRGLWWWAAGLHRRRDALRRALHLW